MSSLSLPEYEGNGGNYIIVCRAAPRAGGRRASPPGGATQKSSAAVVSLGYIPRVMGKDLALRLGVVPITLVDIEVTSVIEHTEDCGTSDAKNTEEHAADDANSRRAIIFIPALLTALSSPLAVRSPRSAWARLQGRTKE